MSQAGWACYESFDDIPTGGGCYTRGGQLLEDDETFCTSELGEFMGLLWLRADEEWGYLDTGCAEDQLHRYAAAELNLDLATVEGNMDTMWLLNDRESMDIPRELEQQQDFKR